MRARRTSRARLGRTFASLALIGVGLAAGCEAQGPLRPNLLLITIDTLRADQLACYGGAPDVGTAICSIADSGIRFQWALATAPHTAPSVASILTSEYPHQHGVRQSAWSELATGRTTVAEVLEDAGYATGAVVSNPVLRLPNMDQGFGHYDESMTRRERNRTWLEEREAESTTDAALAWLADASEPWFLWVHYQDPHGPYEPPDAEPLRDPAGGRRLPPLRDQSGLGGIPDYQVLQDLRAPASYVRRYRDEIRYLDGHVARLLAAVDSGRRRPGILLTADHGEALGEDGYFFAHGHSVALDQIRVPLLWRPALGGAPRVESEPVSLVDVAPTLARAAGVSRPDSFQGRPIQLARAGSGDAERLLFAENAHRAAVIVGRDYFARDREPLERVVTDPVSGGQITPLPPRGARLQGDTAPAYRTMRDSPRGVALESAMSELVARGAAAPRSERTEVSEESRRALEALGYMDAPPPDAAPPPNSLRSR